LSSIGWGAGRFAERTAVMIIAPAAPNFIVIVRTHAPRRARIVGEWESRRGGKSSSQLMRLRGGCQAFRPVPHARAGGSSTGLEDCDLALERNRSCFAWRRRRSSSAASTRSCSPVSA
jgi:hypothetical protein